MVEWDGSGGGSTEMVVSSRAWRPGEKGGSRGILSMILPAGTIYVQCFPEILFER